MNTRPLLAVMTAMLTALLLSACTQNASSPGGEPGAPPPAQAQAIAIDGSSTVYPISEAMAEAFRAKHPEVRITIGVSGTGGGFKKFCRAETAISDASRPIKESEMADCKAAGVEYVEIPVAYDGIAVVLNKENDWAGEMTVEELKKMWEPEAQGKVMKWSDVRDGWPKEELHLFGPGVDSGTYDYFTQAIVGTEHSSRGDFTASEDDNVLVQGVATDKYGLGFFGFAYYAENTERLNVASIKMDKDAKAIPPSLESVGDGTYQPLSRPIFIYVNKKEADTRPIVTEFVTHYLSTPGLVKEVGYIPLPDKAYELAKARFESRTTGSVFAGGGATVGVTVEELLSKEGTGEAAEGAPEGTAEEAPAAEAPKTEEGSAG